MTGFLAKAGAAGAVLFLAILVVCLNVEPLRRVVWSLVGLSHLEDLGNGLLRLFVASEAICLAGGLVAYWVQVRPSARQRPEA